MRTPMWLILGVAINPACLRQTEFHCATSADCGALGRCEPQHVCSFPDATCSGGNRFSDSAGSYANQCVGSGGTDGGVPDGSSNIDAPTIGCPSLYNQLPGGSAHRYRVITATDNWAIQRDFCLATTPSAYLTIPDDAAELQALSTLSGTAQFWVGIDDLVTEGSYVTVKGGAATFLPWAPGAPDNNGPGAENCVAAISATSQLDDLKCSLKLPAICECDP